jgi:hypothetical protein
MMDEAVAAVSKDKKEVSGRVRLDRLIDAGYGMCALVSSEALSHGDPRPESVDELSTVYREIYFRIVGEMNPPPKLCHHRVGDHESLIAAFCGLVCSMQKAGYYPMSREERKI